MHKILKSFGKINNHNVCMAYGFRMQLMIFHRKQTNGKFVLFFPLFQSFTYHGIRSNATYRFNAVAYFVEWCSLRYRELNVYSWWNIRFVCGFFFSFNSRSIHWMKCSRSHMFWIQHIEQQNLFWNFSKVLSFKVNIELKSLRKWFEKKKKNPKPFE